MRKIALCTALIAILASGTASAKNDFEALLGELDFGGSSTTTAAQTLTLDKIAADNLAPAPNTQVSAQEPIVDPVPVPEPQHAESIVMPAPEPDAAADQNVVEPEMSAELGAPVAAPAPACGCSPQPRCNQCCNNRRSCNTQQCLDQLLNKLHGTCVPHTPPNLPTSSFYQYFKSNSCNCRVWDGYQNKCVLCSKHSRGECNCFEPHQSCLSGLSCNTPRCRGGACGNGSCKSGNCCEPAGCEPACCEPAGCDSGCHQLPSCWSKGDCAGEATCAAPSACDSACCDR